MQEGKRKITVTVSPDMKNNLDEIKNTSFAGYSRSEIIRILLAKGIEVHKKTASRR